MTTPDWEIKLQELIHISKPAPPKRPEGTIPLTSAHLDELLGQDNPFCGPTAVWWFTRDDYPFKGRGELWRRAEKMSKSSGVGR
jgi:hypothetical protein